MQTYRVPVVLEVAADSPSHAAALVSVRMARVPVPLTERPGVMAWRPVEGAGVLRERVALWQAQRVALARREEGWPASMPSPQEWADSDGEGCALAHDLAQSLGWTRDPAHPRVSVP